MQTIDELTASTIRHAIGPTILLGSGTYFDFQDPENSAITIDDIAHGLAFEGRFSGQCVSRLTGRRVFYSVAEHCVRMSWLIPQEHAYAALMHEAGEAVCGDMTGPLKSLLPAFKQIEKRCERAIHARFGVDVPDPELLKLYDVRMLATERRDLLFWKGERWSSEDKAEPFEEIEIIPWEPRAAVTFFLERFRELAPEGVPND